MSRIDKCCMRNSPCTAVVQRIIALDEQRLIRSLCVLKVPSMIRISLNSISLTFAVRIDQCSGHKVAVRNRMRVRECQRISKDSLDRAPDLSRNSEPYCRLDRR